MIDGFTQQYNLQSKVIQKSFFSRLINLLTLKIITTSLESFIFYETEQILFNETYCSNRSNFLADKNFFFVVEHAFHWKLSVLKLIWNSH